MKKSEPYQKKISTCHLCKQCWYDAKCSKHCPECGGYAMDRPCVVCGGQCHQTWRRNIAKTHSFHKAHWDGKCDLPLDVQQALMQASDSDISEQSISHGLQCLSTT
ncbi:hypothetical protein DPMN_068800 [Dreissena polymorpha]|uniref:Uncharacterized protein n=2 Tax=Dreissena polymorpha TaxID=45954 RepID=A0A9D4BWV5_DREPO|nr:hypothetical protein DPMN_068800 [Dreissena polymorpha]